MPSVLGEITAKHETDGGDRRSRACSQPPCPSAWQLKLSQRPRSWRIMTTEICAVQPTCSAPSLRTPSPPSLARPLTEWLRCRSAQDQSSAKIMTVLGAMHAFNLAGGAGPPLARPAAVATAREYWALLRSWLRSCCLSVVFWSLISVAYGASASWCHESTASA